MAGTGVGHGARWPVAGGDETPDAVSGWQLADLATPEGYAAALALRTRPGRRWRPTMSTTPPS